MNLTKTRLKLTAAGCFALALAAVPLPLLAQNAGAEKQPPAAQTEDASKRVRKPGAGPFHGKLAALDKAARTITVGKRTFQITVETKINKAGKPATLDQAIVGEQVSGYVKPNAQGKLVATTLNLGPKASSKAGANKTSAEGLPK